MGLSAAHNQEAEREAVRVDHVRDLFQDDIGRHVPGIRPGRR